jgi:hypothetical protein
MKFSVQTTQVYGTKPDGSTDYAYENRVTAFKAVGYSGPGVNFPTESKVTLDKAQAEDWAVRASAGETVPEAKFASYSDD